MKRYRSGLLYLGLLWLGMAICMAQEKPAEERPAPPGSSNLPKIQPPPPPPPKVPEVRQPGEIGWWIGVDGWFPTQAPSMNKGRAAIDLVDASNIDLQGHPKVAGGVEAGISVGLHNALRFSFFDTKGQGNVQSIPTDLQLWGQVYFAGTYLSSNYSIQNAKLSFDYLTWPYPVESRHFRLKTLWQIQYTKVTSTFNAPLLPLFTSSGTPILDINGNPISYVATGNRWFVYPELGLGVAYYSGRHLRLEANLAGFTFPHRDAVADGDASANLRFGHIEFRAGYKAFYFKTSPNAEFFMKRMLNAGFVGVRWNSQ